MTTKNSSVDKWGRTQAFNHLQQLLWNFNGMHRRAIENNDQLLRQIANDSIQRIDYLIVEEQKRIEWMTGVKPEIYNS